MKSAEVCHVKLGRPPEGFRTIVWADGLKEKNMLVEAETDWDIHILIDKEPAKKETFCVAISPDGEELRVTRMIYNTLPKKLKLTGSDIEAVIGGPAIEMEPRDIVSSIRGKFEE